MEFFFDKIFEMFSLEYIFSVIVASYLIIKAIDFLNGVKKVPVWAKRVVTFTVGMALFWVFRVYTDYSISCLITSYFASVFMYDTAIRVIIQKLKMGYKK